MPNSNNIFLFCGEDTYSAYQKSKHWRDQFEKKYGDININIFEGAKLTAEQLIETLDSIPFLSEKKLTIVNDFLSEGEDEDQKKIAEKIENLPDHNILVFIEEKKPDARMTLYKKLKKIGQIEEFNYLVGPKLNQWIQKEMAQAGAKLGQPQINIGSKEAQILAEMVGPNLWQMKQEVEKLALYSCTPAASNGSTSVRPITEDIIHKLANPNLSTSVFKLTDYIGQKKAKDSLKTFNTLIESGEDIIKIFFMIVRQFRILIQIDDCLKHKMNKNEITAKLKEHPYVVMTSMGQCKNFNTKKLQEIYNLLLKIDTDLKTGKIKMTEIRLVLEKFIVELSN